MQRRNFMLAMALAPARAPDLAWAQPSEPAASRLILLGDTAPFAYLGADGHPSGVAYDMTLEVSKTLPWALRPEVVPFVRGFHEAQTRSRGPVLLLPPARIPSREKLLKWISPLVPVRFMVFARADSMADISTLSAAQSLSIGAMSATGLEDLYRGSGFHRLQMLATNETAVRMLLAQRFEAILTADLCVYHALQQMGLPRTTVREGVVVRHVQLWLSASLDYPDGEVHAWRAAVDAAHARGVLDPILARYGLPSWAASSEPRVGG